MMRSAFLRVKRTRFGPYLAPLPLEGRNPAGLPKKVYMFWDKGFDAAPDLVKACVETWYNKNHGWEIELLDAEEANKVVDRRKLPDGILTAHYADILRTRLLRDRGGVWADATSICNHPLDHWMPAVMAQCDFFAYRCPRPARIVSNWFLVSKPGGLIIDRWMTSTDDFWKNRKKPPVTYYWHDFSFEWLYRTSSEFRREWAKTPNYSATPTHRFLKLHAENKAPDETDLNILRSSHVHKLSWKENLHIETIMQLLRT